MNRFNKADKTLVILFIAFVIFLFLHVNYPQNIVLDLLLFCSEAALVGGIADWFAVTALFKKPLGFPFHTAILPKRRKAFVKSCMKMLETEFLSKRKIYKRICNADILSKALIWLKKTNNKQYVVDLVMRFFVKKVENINTSMIVDRYFDKIVNILMKESMESLSNKISEILLKRENSKVAVNKILLFLQSYFSGEEGKQKVALFIENYQKQYEKGFGSMMLSIALATNALDPEELTEVIHKRLEILIQEYSVEGSNEYEQLVDLYETLVTSIQDDEAWIDNLNGIKEHFITSGALKKVLINVLDNTRDSLLINIKEKNKLYLAIEKIFSDELERCIEKLNTNNDFKSKINRFVLDVVHRSALKGEDLILELARKFLEGLTDEQLNELVYDKVETDMIWIRLNGSIVGGFIGFVAYWILYVVNN